MIYRHKRTKDLYLLLFESFSVERQRPSMVYMSVETGQIFDRDKEAFKENFAYYHDSQERIVPK
jgi:hypothetical protein